MGWAKFDDQFTDHPKVLAAGPMAELLAMRAVIYCARYETDGHVSQSQLPRLALGITSPKKQVAALVATGLWEERDDGWVVHDFLDYHPSKEEQDAKREQARERMAKHRKTKPADTSTGSQDVRANTSRSAEEVRPTPTPTPSRTPKEPTHVALVEDDDEFDRFWNQYPRHHDTKALGGGGVKKQAKTAWRRLTPAQRQEAIAALETYAKVCRPDGQKPKHAERFLRNDAWKPYLPDARDGPSRDRICPDCDRSLDANDHDELCDIWSGRQVV